MGNGMRLAKNTVYLYLRMIVVVCVGLYTSRVILSALGVDDFGVYSAVGGIVLFFAFLRQALTNATYRHITYALGSGAPIRLKRAFAMSLNTHFVMAGAVLVLAETVGLWLVNTQLVIPSGRLTAANVVYQFSVLAFCVSVVQIPYTSAVQAHERMGFFALTSLWEAGFKLAVAFFLVSLPGDKLINYSWLLAAVAVFLYIWYRYYCRCHFAECHYARYWDWATLRHLLSYSGWSILVNAADVAVAQSTVFFFNVFAGLAANAALNLANTVNTQLYQLLNNFSQAYEPQIIKSYAAGERQRFFGLIYGTSKLSYYLMLLVSVPVLLNVEFLLGLWLEVVPPATGELVAAMVLFSLIDAYSAPLWIAVHANGNLRTHQIMIGGIKILCLPLTYVLLREGFSLGVVVGARAALNFVCSIARPLYMKRLIGLQLRVYARKMALPILAVTALALPLPLWFAGFVSSEWARLFTTSGAFALIMTLVTYTVGLNTAERQLLTKALKSKFSKK